MGQGQGHIKVQIDRATTEDIAAIATLWHAGWHQAHASIVPAALGASRTAREFTDRTTAHLDQTFVARIEGTIAGFYMLRQDELYQFYIDAAFQGRGIASRLMAEAEAALAGRVAWLACTRGNDRAAAFYAKVGWRCTATRSYEAETADGHCTVTVWRFEKDLRSPLG